MTEPGWYYGFLCHECGIGLPVERRDNAAAGSGARPIAIGAWEIRCPFGLGRQLWRRRQADDAHAHREER